MSCSLILSLLSGSVNLSKLQSIHLDTPLYDTFQSNGSDIFRKLYLFKKFATSQSIPIDTKIILNIINNIYLTNNIYLYHYEKISEYYKCVERLMSL